MRFTAGDRIAVRGDRWIVDETTTFSDCAVLTLSAADPLRKDRTCRLLLPFDRPISLTGLTTVRVSTPRRWMHHLHGVLSDLRPFGELRATAGASIDVLPFQLEPALALIWGRASRFLLADEVGLGKTIQAGLMMAELQLRGWCERALIVTPAGLRRQWAEELQRRFGICAVVVDAGTLSALANSLPHDVNPWSIEPVFITSLDFIKQPEVLRGLCSQPWDLLIVDEAHQASAGSLRYEAVRTLADRSRCVVLLTATPHSGDDAAYRALCDVGRLDRADPILLFRRTRQQAGLPRTRRVHLLRVRLTPEATAMHQLLAVYVAQLWRIAQHTKRQDLHLVAMVLNKRAFSSARSLAASVQRRLGAISGVLPIEAQWCLPFDSDADPADEAPFPIAPAFERQDEEEAALRQLLNAATDAQADERKICALKRLLRRVREPIIVFTEYRDTLETLESALAGVKKTAVLHGGHTRQERHNAVEAFTSGAADLLLATDAGAEGLNLQSRCRLVVNLELPWNPSRLEQRIGRVDRIGQTRTVHAINLFAEGTAESTVLAALLRRFERILASEIEIAASVIGSAPLPVRSAGFDGGGAAETVNLKAAAEAEATRIRAARVTLRGQSFTNDGVIPVLSTRSMGRRSPSVIWFVRIRIANRLGRLMEDRLVPVVTRGSDYVPTQAGHHLRRRELRAIARQIIDAVGPAVIHVASQLAEERAQLINREVGEWLPRAMLRENYLSRTAVAGVSSLIQPGLFDNRAVKQNERAEHQHRSFFKDCEARAALLEATATAMLAHEPQIALVLITRC